MLASAKRENYPQNLVTTYISLGFQTPSVEDMKKRLLAFAVTLISSSKFGVRCPQRGIGTSGHRYSCPQVSYRLLLGHTFQQVCVCEIRDVLCVHDTVRQKVEAKCGWGPLALVQGADTSYDEPDKGRCFLFTPVFLLLLLCFSCPLLCVLQPLYSPSCL